MSNSGANFESLTKGQGLSLKVFGAKWNGVTDDSVPLEKAMAASVEQGGTPILLPEGTGVINSIPKIPKNISCQIPIVGSRMLNTVVKLPEALTFLTFANTVAGDTVGNLYLADFTVDGNNQNGFSSAGIPVIAGTTSECREQVNIKNVQCRRLKTINVAETNEERSARRNILFDSFHSKPGLSLNKIENIDIRECELFGSQYGVNIAGTAPSVAPINVMIDNIYIGDCKQTFLTLPSEHGFCAGFQIGQYGWSEGRNIVVERCFTENSGDVGVEMDVPGIVRDCRVVNAFNVPFLFNTFNPTSTKSPIVTTTSAVSTVGESKIKVVSSASFTTGEEVVLYGTKVSNSEVRVIKAVPDSEHIEFTENMGLEHAKETIVQQVDDLGASIFRGENLRAKRTVTSAGSNGGAVTVQNVENVIPCFAVDIDGLEYIRTAKDIVNGDCIKAQFGTTNSPTGQPKYLRIKRINADIKNVEYGGTETKNYWPISLIGKGSAHPLEIQGIIKAEGVGITSTGKIEGPMIHIATNAIGDIDMLTQFNFTNMGGSRWFGIGINESTVGDFTGRIRHRTRSSSVKEGASVVGGIRLGKGCGFGSKALATKLTAEAAIGSTTWEVESNTGFSTGEAVVIDALSTSKSEIFVVSSIESTNKIKIVSVGTSPGPVAAHAVGATVAGLKSMVIEDCDWFGLGSSATNIGTEDANVLMRVRASRNVLAAPISSATITLPASPKIFQIIQAGQSGLISVEGGTVTDIEYSNNGSTFFKAASLTGGLLPVYTGDFVKLTWSVEPIVKFIPSRV